MRLIMTVGGLIGFTIGIGFGLLQSSPWPSVLWRASVTAYLAGMLMKWWGQTWIKGLEQARLEKQKDETS